MSTRQPVSESPLQRDRQNRVRLGLENETVPFGEQAWSEEVLLDARGLTVRYEVGELPILSDISFRMHRHESVLLLGPSGCGKSTLAMVLAGLVPNSVEAVLEGEVWHHAELSKPGAIGYVFQDPEAQFCMLQVADEIAFGLENHRVLPAQMTERMHASLDAVHLSVPLDARHEAFSGGMKQKLAVACALAMEPELLVLDEPTANLDPLSTAQVFHTLASLRADGRSLLIIEHKFEAILPYVDTVVLFTADGRIHRQGPVAQVIASEWEWMQATGISTRRPLPTPAWSQTAGESSEAKRLLRVASDTVATRSAAQQGALGEVVQATGACVALGGKPILHSIDFTLRQGEFVALVGPNGSGKSTLLQTLAGLVLPSGGSVRLFGKASKAWKSPELYRKIAVSFQNPESQFVYERVGEELSNRLLPDGVPDDIVRLLSKFGLDGLAEQSPFALSQGQKRRLSVAAMLREEHDLYLLDEPTYGQDARTLEALLKTLDELHRSGRTIVVSTHDMELAARFATRVVALRDGEIVFDGPPTELFQNPEWMGALHLLSDVELPKVDPSPTWTPPPTAKVRRRPPVAHLHPVWFFLAVLSSAAVMMFAQNVWQGLAMLAWPLILLMAVGWQTPRKIAVRLSPFVLLYVLSIISFTLNAAVPPGPDTFHFLWWNPSLAGFIDGIVLACRMTGAVALGFLFLVSLDITDLTVGLTKDFRLPPKFAYGLLAGFRVMPLFQTEWQKIRQARKVRGKDPRTPLVRAATFALPILAQAVRMSERVAIAMEARGLVQEASLSAKHRTFFRAVRVRTRDWVVAVLLPLSVALLLVLTARL
ncbi:ATP-binding cassette domain-containing protein [Alicyclobacillus sp. SP_1]|uniref:ATP-binding cassette domain-containing protein n=1 Tax=Alicyclobacillus sp. SP_1 TaxID=2942475 RepID=UPI0021584F70|nr:ATP-binding cassette domain-containing protein [Alicyclobacillus sp. SP_1]